MTDPWAQRAPDMPALLCADPARWEALKTEPEGQNSPEWPIEQVRAAEAAARIFWPLGNTKLEKRLPLIEAPTLLLWGEQDRIMPRSYADKFAGGDHGPDRNPGHPRRRPPRRTRQARRGRRRDPRMDTLTRTGGVAMTGLSEILETGEAERLATGFVFTEGPLWHPDGFYYFVDVRASRFYRIRPGGQPEIAAREYRRRQRHDLRPAGPARHLRGRQPAADALAGGRAIRVVRGADRPRRGQAAQPPERCRVPLRRQHLFHRSRACACRSPSASRKPPRFTGSSRTARYRRSPISSTRTGLPSRPTSARCTSPIPASRCTSTRSRWTATAT